MGNLYIKNWLKTDGPISIEIEEVADILRTYELDALSQNQYEALDFTLVVHGKVKPDGPQG